MDWSATALGPVGRWPATLQAAVRLCMASPAPMALWAGPDLALVQNDAYGHVLGAEPGGAMGRPVREVLPELWSVNAAQVAPVLEAGATFRRENAPIVLRRDGTSREAFLTFSLSPILEDDGRVLGVLHVVEETTAAVRALREEVAERRRREADGAVLAAIGDDFARLTTEEEITRAVGARLAAHLRISTCSVADLEGDLATLRSAFSLPGVPAAATALKVPDYLDEELQAAARAGETIVLRDVRTDPRVGGARYEALGVRAGVIVPFLSEGTLRHSFAVGTPEPRDWMDHELRLLQEVAGRFFPRVARARAQARLVDRELRLRRLIEANPLGIVEGDAEGRIVAANDAYLRIVGHTRADLEAGAIRWDAITPPEFLPFDAAAVAQVRERGVSSVYEKEYVRADGRRMPVLVACASFGADGGLVAFVADIGDRKRAEQALRESEERARSHAAELETVLHTVPAAVWIARDPRADRIDANRYGTEILRRSPGENVSVTAPGADRPRNFTVRRNGKILSDDELAIQRTARFGVELRDYEMEVVFEDGDVRHLLGNATPLRDRDGSVRGSVGAFIDITARRAAEEALREADRRKTEFIALLSHELRNPLASIHNGLVLLERAPPGSAAAQRARTVLHRQSEQLTRLVDDLLDISRITYGKLEVQRTSLDAREVVRRACADAHAPFEARGVELCTSEPAAPLWVDADAARLAQMVGNLLHNALKFTAPGGRVAVASARQGDACEIRVRDTGQGLDPSELERIFDPFVQSARTGRHGGLGLGLALVRELAAKHGGSVRALSEGEGKGAEFVLTLPVTGPPREVRAGGAAWTGSPAGLAVLVVEDNQDAAESLADLLALSGHRVRVAATGEAGVAAAGAQPFDVLLCDVGLPDMSGHDVIRTLRAREGGRRLFAVALTGYAQPQDRAAAVAAGFDAHVPKPPALETLGALLGEAARRAQRG